jgi:hypothetical protein
MYAYKGRPRSHSPAWIALSASPLPFTNYGFCVHSCAELSSPAETRALNTFSVYMRITEHVFTFEAAVTRLCEPRVPSSHNTVGINFASIWFSSGIATGCRLDRQEVRIRVPKGAQFFFSPRRPERFRGSFPGVKAAKACRWPIAFNLCCGQEYISPYVFMA